MSASSVRSVTASPKLKVSATFMLNEMIEFPGGLYGLALNLEETEVGVVLLGDEPSLKG